MFAWLKRLFYKEKEINLADWLLKEYKKALSASEEYDSLDKFLGYLVKHNLKYGICNKISYNIYYQESYHVNSILLERNFITYMNYIYKPPHHCISIEEIRDTLKFRINFIKEHRDIFDHIVKLEK